MPTYKNTGTTVACIGSLRLEAGESGTSSVFFKGLPAGVIQTGVAPFWNPAVLSEQYPGNDGDTTVVAIPESVNGLAVAGVKGTIYVMSGSVEVCFNDASATPVVKLDAYFSHGFQVRDRLVDSIVLNFTADSSVVKIDLERA